MIGVENYTLEERQQIARTIQQQMGGYVTIKKVEEVYCDTLQSTFEEETGLRLTL